MCHELGVLEVFISFSGQGGISLIKAIIEFIYVFGDNFSMS